MDRDARGGIGWIVMLEEKMVGYRDARGAIGWIVMLEESLDGQRC